MSTRVVGVSSVSHALLHRAGARGPLVVMVGLTLLASIVNYGSSLVFSRILTPESFGDLTALLALSVVMAVPTGAAQTVVAARVARFSADGDEGRIRYIVRYAGVHVGTVATCVTLLYLAGVPLVDRALSLQASGPAFALAPLIWLTFLVPVALGVLQGLDRYIAFGLMSLGVAISRLVFGIPLTEIGGGAGGALAGQAIGQLFVVLTAAYLLRHWWSHRGTGAARAGFKRVPNLSSVSATAPFVAFAVISNFDVVLAKIFLDPRAVGLYAALATVAKIFVFLPGAVAVALVPSAARAGTDVLQRSRALQAAALAVVAATVFVALPMALMPKLTLRIMFGDTYEVASSGLFPMLLAGTGLALLYLLVFYAVTIEDSTWIALLVLGVVMQVVGIVAFHESPTQIAVVQASVVAALLALNELAFHPLLRRPRLAENR